jgi:hypothetical protein
MKNQIFSFFVLLCCIAFPPAIQAQHSNSSFEEVSEIPKGKAVVYIYRVSSYAVAIRYKVNANDKPVMTSPLRIGYYMVYFADPGKLELWAEMGKHHENINLDIEAGKSYFVEGSVVSDAWVSMPKFELVPAERALKKIHKCKLLSD